MAIRMAVRPAFLLALALVAAVVVGALTSTVLAADGDENVSAGRLDGLVAPLHYIMLLPPDDLDLGTVNSSDGFGADTPVDLQVIELIRLHNPAGTPVDTAVIPLFAGASDLELWSGFEGVQIQASPEAIRASTTIEGGDTRTFGVAYQLPASAFPRALARAVAHPTERLLVLLPQGSIVEPLADGLESAGTDQFAGRQVDVYSLETLAPVMEWVLGLRVSGATTSGLGSVPVIDRQRTEGQGAWLLVLIAFAVIAVGAAAVFLLQWWRQRGFQVPPEPPAWVDPAKGDPSQDKGQAAEELLQVAARLEQAHAEGRCSESLYRSQRQRLIQAWKRLHLNEQDLAQP